jgi:8-oxo-dGTP pyrophosphatase MutT (NUDIX family)
MNGDEQRDSGYISDSELRGAAKAVRPRDAATLIIVRNDSSRPRVLMGRRAARHAFMPNKFVFPGGKVDRSDSRILPPHDLHPEVMKRLRRGCSETRARALALAAIRETYEETGLIIGEPATPTLKSRARDWHDFLRHGINPRLDVLHLVARAITPPYRNRRFDARFFMVDAVHIQGEVQERPEGSGELLDLHWVGVDEAQRMEQLPHVTRTVLGALEQRLREGAGHHVHGPFLYVRHGKPVVDFI